MVYANGGIMKHLDGTDVEIGKYVSDNGIVPPMLTGNPKIVDKLMKIISKA